MFDMDLFEIMVARTDVRKTMKAEQDRANAIRKRGIEAIRDADGIELCGSISCGDRAVYFPTTKFRNAYCENHMLIPTPETLEKIGA